MAQIIKAGLTGLLLLGFVPSAAHAQPSDSAVATALRECRTIDDTAARAACYDDISLGDAARPKSTASAPREGVAPEHVRTGFGANQLVRPESDHADEPNGLRIAVAAAAEREPGVYQLTLADGTQWQFIDAVGSAYDPPERGSTVELSRAALGSYLLRYEKQQGVRVRRIH